MAQPTPYVPATSFLTFESTQPELPGQEIDAELGSLQDTTDEILANLALIQRDDGDLANLSVGLDQLKTEVTGVLPLNPATAWATATVYVVRDFVFSGSALYRALVAHTSGTFATDLAAAKWILVADFASSIYGVAHSWTGLQTFKPTTASGTPGGINDALSANFFAGIAVGPFVTTQLPNVFIGRTEQIIGSTADASSALYVVSNAVGQSSGGALASQTQAIVATADKDANSTGDVVALFGRATGHATTGLGGVFGGFFQAIGHTTHTAPIGVEINAVNASGVAVAYDPLLPPSAASIGVDLVYIGTYFGSTNANGTAAIVIRGDGALNAWDVGIGVLGGGASISPNSVSKAVLQDDSHATNVFLFNSGAHAYGIRGTGATYSIAALAFPGFTVSGTGAVTATTLTATSISADAVTATTLASTSISTGQYTFNNQSNIGVGPGFSHSTGDAFLLAGGSSGFQFNNNAGNAALVTIANGGLVNILAGGLGVGTASDPGTGMIYTNAAAFMIRTKTSYTNGLGAGAGTLTNAPVAGNPTKWIPVDDNGTTRYIPAW